MLCPLHLTILDFREVLQEVFQRSIPKRSSAKIPAKSILMILHHLLLSALSLPMCFKCFCSGYKFTRIDKIELTCLVNMLFILLIFYSHMEWVCPHTSIEHSLCLRHCLRPWEMRITRHIYLGELSQERKEGVRERGTQIILKQYSCAKRR